MPSFPTSVFAPPSRSAGQTIAAAHVNDLQDEVNAIEGGYLNATARLNSSGSTVASLQVTGGSTLVGAVTCSTGLTVSTGNVTFGQNLNIAANSTVQGRLNISSGLSVAGNSTLGSTIALGTIPYIFPSSGGSTGNVLTCISTSGSTMTLEWRAPAGSSTPDAARVSIAADVQVANNSVLVVNWDTQDAVTNSSLHSTATNSSRLTPQSTGVYQLTFQASFNGQSTASTVTARLRILDSSGAAVGVVQEYAGMDVSGETLGAVLQASALVRIDSVGGTPYFTAQIRQRSGSTSRITSAAGDSWFSIVKL